MFPGAVAPPCCWPVEVEVLRTTLPCYVMILSVRSRFEKSYTYSIPYSYCNLKPVICCIKREHMYETANQFCWKTWVPFTSCRFLSCWRVGCSVCMSACDKVIKRRLNHKQTVELNVSRLPARKKLPEKTDIETIWTFYYVLTLNIFTVTWNKRRMEMGNK